MSEWKTIVIVMSVLLLAGCEARVDQEGYKQVYDLCMKLNPRAKAVQ